MKPTKLFLLIICVIAFLNPAIAIAIADDDGDGDGDVIDITYLEPGQSYNRSQIVPPIQASLINQSIVAVTFIYDVGEISIRISNLTTGHSSVTVVDSSFGKCLLPVTGGSGSYCVDFQTENGSYYFGYFLVQ